LCATVSDGEIDGKSRRFAFPAASKLPFALSPGVLAAVRENPVLAPYAHRS
jgi:hypothetical protein